MHKLELTDDEVLLLRQLLERASVSGSHTVKILYRLILKAEALMPETPQSKPEEGK